MHGKALERMEEERDEHAKKREEASRRAGERVATLLEEIEELKARVGELTRQVFGKRTERGALGGAGRDEKGGARGQRAGASGHGHRILV